MKKFLPHLVALCVFLVLTFAYLYPVFQGKIICGSDTRSYLGMSKEAVDYNRTHSSQTLWTNAMFGGMPTYQISMTQPGSLLSYVDACLRVLPGPTYRVFLYLVGFYILLLIFGLNPYWAIGLSVAFAFGSYNLIVIVAGHNTKAVAIAYMAPILASIYYAFRKNPWVGSALLALFLGLGLYANHVQIVYYTVFVVLCFGISELVFAIREKTVGRFFQIVGILCLGALLAAGLNATRLITTAEYVNYTMRGASNGLSGEGDNQHGLDKDYITAWSYGKAETATLLIPNFMGGASSGVLDEDSHTARALAERTGYRATGKGLSSSEKARIDRMIAKNPDAFRPKNLAELMYIYPLPLYWGDQPFTSGPVYAGAIVIFLFVLGMRLLPNRQRWWLLAAAVVGTALAWGRNFMPLTDFFIDYVPMYNKFRTVSMTLTITCMVLCLTAGLALKEWYGQRLAVAAKRKALYIAAGITGGFCLLLAVFPGLAGSFEAPGDARLPESYAFMRDTLPLDRQAMLQADAWRSFGLIVAAALLLWVYTTGKIKGIWTSAVLLFLFVADMLPVAARYLNSSNFVDKTVAEVPFTPSPADKYVLADPGLDFRVLDVTVDIFNSAQPSYFHKTVGGYSAVKMRRYQELITYQLSPEIQRLGASLAQVRGGEEVDSLFATLPILNLLNTRYIIYHPSAMPLLNKSALGNAWTVDKVQEATTPDEELGSLNRLDLRRVAVMDPQTATGLSQKEFNTHGSDIELIQYEPNRLVYTFHAPSNQCCVFSEIYYDKGWKAYIDGQAVEPLRVDYLLRALPVPAGSHEIEFRFEPASYQIGNILSIISSVLLTLAFAGIIFARYRKIKYHGKKE